MVRLPAARKGKRHEITINFLYWASASIWKVKRANYPQFETPDAKVRNFKWSSSKHMNKLKS